MDGNRNPNERKVRAELTLLLAVLSVVLGISGAFLSVGITGFGMLLAMLVMRLTQNERRTGSKIYRAAYYISLGCLLAGILFFAALFIVSFIRR